MYPVFPLQQLLTQPELIPSDMEGAVPSSHNTHVGMGTNIKTVILKERQRHSNVRVNLLLIEWDQQD